LLTAVLARQAAAAVGVETCWSWGNCCYVAVKGQLAGGGGILWRPPAQLVRQSHAFALPNDHAELASKSNPSFNRRINLPHGIKQKI